MADVRIAPSILSADFARLGEEIAAISDADWIHVDIMDGHFVPNLSFGPDVTKTVDRLTEKELDVHLMIENPEKWVETYARAGADTIIIHVEATNDPAGLLRQIKELGVKAGFCIKPATNLEDHLELLEIADELLVMSVEPGFGGQSFMEDQLAKVRTARTYIDERNLATVIEIDGGINEETIGLAVEAGVDAVVAGSSVYGHDNANERIQALRSAARQA
ncbi:ribulose-phosphate 3-epimerase [Corynebacterium tapiri]|uniref:Ribulose-phosphate 3-epimerase n=1 Tax=Corynebacterium tapiri TaxID=1448266 RepID=A0A5C4U4X7_9CORY|nr:ribulose-phosphate 3-epimerase [Corynebacterium tapiri]TNL97553.1 ribulose-phosphate 3-epimerase [Corynebacterium tapiri]